MTSRKLRILLLALLGLLLIGLSLWLLLWRSPASRAFNGSRAYQDVVQQVSFGPRVVGSPAHAKAVAYIQSQLHQAGWQTEIQSVSWQNFPVENIIAYRTNQTPAVLLGAHYDSRSKADQDQGPGRDQAVPGANDGASGVAVLLELARTLPKDIPPTWLVFFDAEDDGELNGRQWTMGADAFVAHLTFRPSAVIVLDMIGDANLDIYIEANSNRPLVDQIWGQAKQLGYDKQFIPTVKFSMEDDHTPFLAAGLPAVDIIDFDYPYWHTTADTPDKVSPVSLQIVGETVGSWLKSYK